tara:strand:- start:378 stop:782 length:405 start_codon:yes stop_codon:yes gene_type:complete
MSQWKFVHAEAGDADRQEAWTEGLRSIFDYRDLGISAATGGDYVAHMIRANGRSQPDDVQQWHIHHCDFQFVQVLEGWAKFEYEGQGVHTIRKGDFVLQPPRIKHRELEISEDFAVLEIVAPANFETEVVEPPA